jgi:hypothetical protein
VDQTIHFSLRLSGPNDSFLTEAEWTKHVVIFSGDHAAYVIKAAIEAKCEHAGEPGTYLPCREGDHQSMSSEASLHGSSKDVHLQVLCCRSLSYSHCT